MLWDINVVSFSVGKDQNKRDSILDVILQEIFSKTFEDKYILQEVFSKTFEDKYQKTFTYEYLLVLLFSYYAVYKVL